MMSRGHLLAAPGKNQPPLSVGARARGTFCPGKRFARHRLEGAAESPWLVGTSMPIKIIKRPLRATTGYEAPPKGFPRVHLTRNGVQMLAAVNGRGAYDANGPKKQRRKAKRKAAKARSYSTKARRKGISATKRATYRRKAAKATRKSKKRSQKAEYQKYVKRMASKAGLTRKELIRLLRGEGMSGKAAESVASCAVGGGGGGGGGGTCAPGHTASTSTLKEAARLVDDAVRGGNFSYSPNGPDAEIFFDNRKGRTMAGRKRKRKAGRKAARRGTRKVARRGKSRRSRSSSRRRTSSKRRSTKRSSRKAGRRSTARGRGRRGMRRNGSDDFEMNGLEYEANGDDFEMNGSDDFESNGYDFESNAKKRGKGKKRKSPSKASKFNKKLLKETGILRDFGPEPVAGMMIDSLADRLRSRQITPEAYKAMRKQIAKAYLPQAEGQGRQDRRHHHGPHHREVQDHQGAVEGQGPHGLRSLQAPPEGRGVHLRVRQGPEDPRVGPGWRVQPPGLQRHDRHGHRLQGPGRGDHDADRGERDRVAARRSSARSRSSSGRSTSSRTSSPAAR